MKLVANNLIFEDCKKSCGDIKSLSELKGNSILVTGGTGFVGKWISEIINYINKTGDYNIKLYLLARDIVKFQRQVPHLADLPFISLIEQDAGNIHQLPIDINYIIHAAGSPDNREHVSQPLNIIESFYKGTAAVLDAATRLPNLKKIIHISSHKVYGKNELEKSINESFSGKIENNKLDSIYAESKRIAETLCLVYRNNFRLPIVTLRPFAFIGPYQDLDKPWAINNFIRDAILGVPIRILGNGLSVRSYLYGSDMGYWIIKSLLEGEVGEVYNIGSSEAVSLNNLAKKINNSLDSNNEILNKSSKDVYTDLSVIVPDNSKIIKHFGVSQNFNLEDSISRTIVWNQLIKK